MSIIYSETKQFKKDDLGLLFTSVDWDSGKYPDKLQAAMLHSDTVYSAWHNDTLVGLMNAICDQAMIVYFHYLLIHPDFQKMGIGKSLVDKMLNTYKHIPHKVLISYNNQVEFYEKCGFEIGENTTPVFITDF